MKTEDRKILEEKIRELKKVSDEILESISNYSFDEQIEILNLVSVDIRHQIVIEAQKHVEELIKEGKTELWKPVLEDPEYEISNMGRLRKAGDISNESATVGTPYKSDYLKTSKKVKRTTPSMHRLVAEAFIPNDDNLPYVNHKSEKKYYNDVWNLEWINEKDNAVYGKGGIKANIIKKLYKEEKAISDPVTAKSKSS